ncbi:hypothetical protein KIN20_015959 [Parelaphostrongylus tenuis]|uniref:Uncharacterized protein n=1 Tax=Parelaphostrongylus tenuis TaxID=148309 RepID=A0AAD5N4S0_PARTN|nr:hypothetical protein KIN20_015959 [Parelaphostrongylus tenuis]
MSWFFLTECFVYVVFVNSVLAFNILILACYVSFICFLKKVKNDTKLIALMGRILQPNIERIHIDLLAGLFVNFASAANFFVYYVVSEKYRNEFDEKLCITNVRNFFGMKSNGTVAIISMYGRCPKLASQRTSQSRKRDP